MARYVVDHPLLKHKLTLARDEATTTKDFRDLVREVALVLAVEATRNLAIEPVEVQTPLARTEGARLAGAPPVLVPVFRAGLGMVDGFLAILPDARIGHLGLHRDPVTHRPVEYYFKMPSDLPGSRIFVLDPMLATGGSSAAAIERVKEAGGDSITLVSLIAAPEGLAIVEAAHPDIDIYLGAVDDHLDEHAYIFPGLGDAGDRLFGTE